MEKGTKSTGGVKKKAKVKVFNKKRKPQPENLVIENLKSQYETIDTDKIIKFVDLPLTQKTVKGLKESKYLKLTDIQKASIPLALQGKDILGAAQTGSGKTLAFLIPILEKLYCEQWTNLDGLGALVITPTRELAYQIFETLRRIGKYHDFSAGLIIGGKDLKFETKRMDQCNIIICTPGRLLQHMDENPLLDCVNMKILVLDEADRCLDMGFKETMNAVIANLPLRRQTLLFSATQTKSVQDLARLSLKDPSYVSVNEMTTPKELQQSYVVCELQDKLSIIWSFIRNHLKQKTIIFFSTCKQVKYFYEMFCKLRPGLSLLPLYGTLHQLRRMKIYEEFCSKKSAVLFATDLAARGLDFPEVHWVVQADCPEDVETYIHRVGRTARYHKGGESLLLLMSSELKMAEYLEEKKIPIEKIDINPSKLQNPIRKMELIYTKDSTLKDTAQRAVSHYAKAIFFMKHKEVFNVHAVDFKSFSKSLGLHQPPRIRFLDRINKKQQILSEGKPDCESEQNRKVYFESPKKSNEVDSTKVNSTTLKFNSELPDSDEDDLFGDQPTGVEFKKIPPFMASTEHVKQVGQVKKKPITKPAAVKLMLKKLKKNETLNTKIVFTEEGTAVVEAIKEKKSDLAREFENEDVSGIDVEKATLALIQEDKFDNQMFKAGVRAKHKEEKRKLKALKKQEQDAEKDEFGESGDDEGPDLSWLPDPDKVYDSKRDGSDDNKPEMRMSESIGKSDSALTQKVKIKKRKRNGPDNLETVLKRKKKQRIERLDVNETEELALMLLKGKK